MEYDLSDNVDFTEPSQGVNEYGFSEKVKELYAFNLVSSKISMVDIAVKGNSITLTEGDMRIFKMMR